MDEVGFALSSGDNYRILARKGSRHINLLTSTDRQHITVVFCTYCLEPVFILRGSSQVNTFTNHCKAAGFYNPFVLAGDKAYLDYSCFEEWAKYFIKNAKFDPASYSFLIYDGHVTHTMHLEVLKLLNLNQTFAVCIPSHSSHIFNVGDVAVFGKLKDALKQTEYMREKGRNILLQDFPSMFKMAWNEAINQSSIISTFRGTGIYPFNKNWISLEQNIQKIENTRSCLPKNNN